MNQDLNPQGYRPERADGEYGYGVMPLDVNRFMAKVYGWMFFGLLVSAISGVALYGLVTNSYAAFNFFFGGYTYLILCIVELALVFVLSGKALQMSKAAAVALFFAYAVLNGVTLTVVGLIYAGTAIVLAFALTAISFGIMSVVGLTTKADLSGMGKLLMFGLLGVIIASVLNMFLQNSAFDLIICLVGLFIFLGLVKYDSQKIKTVYFAHAAQNGPDMATKVAIVGALALYLDFVNIFLFIIRIIGRK